METEILKIRDENDVPMIEKAARLLDEGTLVAIPTETVFGIACKVDPKCLERLDIVKDRQLEKHYTLHVGSNGQLQRYVPKMTFRVRKLIQHVLPGPVTIVFELDDETICQLTKDIGKTTAELLYADNTIGIRYPDNSVACAILAQVKSPIVVPSANPAGQPPAISVEQVESYFAGEIDYIVDTPDSGCDYKKSSTVVKAGKKRVEILREGVLSKEEIQAFSTINIIFVCTGNTCRSPMAEGICQKYFASILGCAVDELDNFGYKVMSAGVAAMDGMSASAHSEQVCRQHGISLQEHKASPLTMKDIQDCDLIFVMGHAHLQSIIEYCPQADQKTFLLDDESDIADPIGRGVEVYQRCFEQIEKAIKKRVSEIL